MIKNVRILPIVCIQEPKVHDSHPVFGRPNTWEVVFKGRSFYQLDSKLDVLARPDTEVVVHCLTSKGSKMLIGIGANTELMIANDNVYKRLSYRAVGVEGKQSGMRVVRDGRLIYFVEKLPGNDAETVCAILRKHTWPDVAGDRR